MLRKKEKAHKLRKRKGFNFLQDLFLLIVLFLIVFLFEVVPLFAQEKQTQEQALDNIEEKIFHQKFNSELKEERVTRLEDFVFGRKFSNENIESRMRKLTNALQVQIKPHDVKPLLPENDGVIGAISQIEIKMFNKTFNDFPFQARISALEDRLLSKAEIIQSRKKPLLERVTILVDKSGLLKNTVSEQPSIQNKHAVPSNRYPKNYAVDPNKGLLIDEQTGEVAKDVDGNPISVMLPQPNYNYQPSQNPYPNPQPYGNQLPQNPLGGQSPYDFLFNQGNIYGGSDPGY